MQVSNRIEQMRWIHCVMGIVLAFTQFAGCSKRPVFDPSLAGRFFPLREGSIWTYRIAYANGARETLVERVIYAKLAATQHGEALVVSEYSGF